MANIRRVFESVIRCVNETRWEDFPKYVQSSFIVNGGEHTPESYVTELKTAGDTEITLEIVTVDSRSQRLGATILVKWKPCQLVMGLEPAGKTIEFMDQLLVWFAGDGNDDGNDDVKISQIVTLSDRESIYHQLSDPEAAINTTATTISYQGGGYEVGTLGSVAPPNGCDLEETYKAYLDCINKRTMETDLPKFCHPRVFHNGQELSLDKYRHLMQDAIDAIPDINFGLHTLITAKDAQRIAVRLEFTGTPVKAIQGVEPNGRSVHFTEHVTYQLREGKIDRVWSIVDWVSYRQQLLHRFVDD